MEGNESVVRSNVDLGCVWRSAERAQALPQPVWMWDSRFRPADAHPDVLQILYPNLPSFYSWIPRAQGVFGDP